MGDVVRRRGRGQGRRRNRQIEQLLEEVNLDAAGVDIGARAVVICVPKGRDPKGQHIRTFSTLMPQLREASEWLKQCGVRTVAMESTGVYWIPLYELLEEQGFEVYLVDARKVKNVSGRKKDETDAEWLQKLHRYGLLHPAFRPEGAICELRGYQRQRSMLVKMAATVNSSASRKNCRTIVFFVEPISFRRPVSLNRFKDPAMERFIKLMMAIRRINMPMLVNP